MLSYDSQSSRNTSVSGVFPCPKTGFSLIFSLIGSIGGNCANKTLHAVGTFTLHLVSHMTIYVQHKGRCGVAQVPLHRLDVVSGADRGNCVGVTQVVETGIGTTDGRNNALVLTIDGRLCQVCPELVGKDQALRILPVTAQQKFLLHLPSALLLQPSQHSLCRSDGAASTILWRNKLIALAPLVLMQLHLLFHRDDTCMKVDAVPRQAQYLALPHTGEQCQDKQRFKAVSLYSGQKCGDLCVIKRLDLLTLYPRQDTGISRVVSQIRKHSWMRRPA